MQQDRNLFGRRARAAPQGPVLRGGAGSARRSGPVRGGRRRAHQPTQHPSAVHRPGPTHPHRRRRQPRAGTDAPAANPGLDHARDDANRLTVTFSRGP